MKYFFGEDSFTAKGRVLALAHEMQAQVLFVDEDDIKASSLESILDRSAGSLFGRTLVIFRDPLSYSDIIRDALADYVVQGGGNAIVFWQLENVDARLGLHKQLLKHADVEQFPGLMNDLDALQWVQRYVREYSQEKTSMSPDAVKLLIQKSGYDTWALASEIQKLCTGVSAITADQVAQAVTERMSDEASIFPLLEAIVAKRGDAAMRMLAIIMESGASERFVLSMLAYQFRLFLAIQAGLAQGDSLETIARTAKLHPIAIKKAAGIARRISLAAIHDVLVRIMASEKSLYTTTMDPRSIVTMLVATLATSA